MAKIKVKVEKTETGYSAYAEKFGAFTTGTTYDQLVSNMVEALNFYFEDEKVKRKVITLDDILFEFELNSLFEVYPINMKGLAERLKMNYTLLAQYATGKKKPSQKQTEKILQGINQVGRELSELTLVAN
ncbi:MAG: hypothetical protein ACK5OS_01625 [Chryseotalea sp.]|jgi:predicted RNase H-like HicB family nuclease